LENTKAPEPVSSVTAAAKLAEDGVAKKVKTPVPAPAKLAVGNPVVLVNVPEAGVPKAGVTSVGLFDSTLLPEPVDAVTPVPPLATGSVPDTPAVRETPVQLDKLPEVGVPRIGVTSVGLVANTAAPLPVSSVSAAAKLAEDGVAKKVATFVPSPEIPVDTGKPVAFVNVPEVGVPSAGVTSVGDVSVPPATVGEMRCVFCWVKFVPSLHTVIVLLAGMATPVPAAVVLPMTVEL
jgi:hypothetical protein